MSRSALKQLGQPLQLSNSLFIFLFAMGPPQLARSLDQPKSPTSFLLCEMLRGLSCGRSGGQN